MTLLHNQSIDVVVGGGHNRRRHGYGVAVSARLLSPATGSNFPVRGCQVVQLCNTPPPLLPEPWHGATANATARQGQPAFEPLQSGVVGDSGGVRAATCRPVPPSRTAPPPPSPVRRTRVLLGWRVVAGWLSARTAWKAETLVTDGQISNVSGGPASTRGSARGWEGAVCGV